ncbi:FadR/GntR family transcriptional regulator [Sediminispirochaeta bajacaliforniensis]|uniref:FadR/GntR family transcriptional regulator n=1 Tax=Sediminispirochaeta bajacaliforniensis TaxID=148 RepID=UPI00037558F8|nr:GntR family transcriptional regulator [Sediminispirochaeta bajacaliforniensis]
MDKVNSKSRISRVSVVDQVCDAIKHDMFDHVWETGDKLPSESEFAQSFGVNRLSVRMALQKLSTLGLIETRVGEGSFVKDFSLKPILREIAAVYSEKERRKDVEQLRNLLEGECQSLAIIKATDEEKAHLRELLDEYYEKSAVFFQDIDNRQYLEQLVEADFAFHYGIIKLSHNRLYIDIYYMVQQLIRDHIMQLISTRAHRRRAAGLNTVLTSDTHEQMYESIVNGNVEEARRSREQILGIIPIHGMDYFDDPDIG